MKQIAVIDIGSNSVRYMEAECTRNGVHSSSKIIHTTRLAEGQGEDRKLTQPAMERTVQAIRCFKELADQKGIPAFAYATSALREASNQEEFLSKLDSITTVDILSGEKEGQLAFFGISGTGNTLIDIGGGSFQIANQYECRSYPIGCVRLTDRIGYGTPAEIYDCLKHWADSVVSEVPAISSPVVGIGGTITTLAALSLGIEKYDREIVSGIILSYDTLDNLLKHLYEMGPERKNHPLLVQRHSVIMQGGTILKYIMSRFFIPELICSDRDGMEGYAKMLFAGYRG